MSILRMLVCVGALLAATAGHAQSATDDYPNRPIKVIVPFAPGGVTDTIARIWAQRMSQGLGQQLYVENHGGAGGNLGMALAARQPADGYTLLVAASSFAINPVLYARPPYDPFKDFAPVTLIADTPNIVVVHPSVPAKSIGELIALVRASPGKFSYAMSGVGTPNHLEAELLKLAFKLDLVTVPFAGGGPAIQSTVAGHTPIGFVAMTSVPALVESGQLRALAVSGTRRSSVLPDVPTMAEAGIAGQEANTFTALLVPAGTPKSIIDRLHAETVRVLAMPEMRQQLAKLGAEPAGTTPDEFGARLKDEIALWGKVIEDARIEKQ